MLNKIKSHIRNNSIFWVIIVLGICVRILLNSAVDSFDFHAFVMWANYLTVHRIADAFTYLPEGYTPYPPLYYYILWFLGRTISFLGVWENKWLTYLIIRIPVIAADTLIAYLIYLFTQKNMSKKEAIIAVIFYFLHPAVIYNTSIWGQIDAIVTLLGFLSVVAFLSKQNFWGIGLYILGVITKLQILALLPLIVFLSLNKKPGIHKFFTSLLVWGAIAFLPFVPIVYVNGFKWTWDYFFTIPNWYAYTSIYAYNIWAPFGFIVSDNTKLFGLIAYKFIGIGLFWFVAFIILYPLFKKVNRTPQAIMYAAFLLWFDFAFFATRIHSRYLIYSFGFFAPFSAKFPKLAALISIIMIGNLLLPNKNVVLSAFVYWLNQPIVIAGIVIFAFCIFIYSYKLYIKRILRRV